jgi:hypothetical protein
VTPLRRTILAVVGSLAFHTGPLLPNGCGFQVDIPMPEFEFELTEMDFVDPEQQLEPGKQPDKPPEPEVIPPPMGPELPPEGEGPKPEDKPPEPPKPKVFGAKDSKIDKLGPTGSNYFVFLNAKKVAGLGFADSVVDIMAALPDFQFIIEGGGFHALRDFNYLVIASSDFRVVSQTFLAVEYKLSQAEIQAGLDRAAAGTGQKIEWVVKDGRTMGNPVPLADGEEDKDPRWFVFLDDKSAVYVREEFLPSITAGPDASKGKTAGNFVANLTKLKTFAAAEPRAGLQLVFKDLFASLKNVKSPFEIPNDFEIMAEAAEAPELLIKLKFLDAVAAKRFENQWKSDLPRFFEEKLNFVVRSMVRGYYDTTEFTLDGPEVTLRCPFTADQAKTILDLIAGQTQKMVGKAWRRTPEEIEAARKKRDELWEARKNGKLSPSEALDKINGKDPSKKPAPTKPEPAKSDDSKPEAPKPDAPKPEPAPAPTPEPAAPPAEPPPSP